MRNFKNLKQFSEYIANVYPYELEEVETKKGLQRRLKNHTLEEDLKKKVKEEFSFEELVTELKLGPSYNMTLTPWIQIHTKENKSGKTGRYVGISFKKETQEIETWIGFGRSNMKKNEILEQAKQYANRYYAIEPNLKNGYEYISDFSDAVFITKSTKIEEIEDSVLKKDLLYLTELYKKYEVEFENAILKVKEPNQKMLDNAQNVDLQELNKTMLTLVEEVGRLASIMKKLL